VPLRGIKVSRWLFGVGFAAVLAACASSSEKKAQLDVYLQLGVRYLNLNRLEPAKDNLEKVVEQDPDNIQAHNALGYLYEKIQKFPEAKQHYQQALRLAPDDLSIQNNLGRFLCERREFNEGMALLDKAIANLLNDRPWLAITNAGLCQLGLGDQQKAKLYFKQALQLNPGYAPALLEMQKFSYQSGEYWAAKGYLQRYLQVAQQTPGTLWIAMQTEQALGNQNLADEYRNELLEKYPLSPEARQVQTQP
jgi:type IV pilus assembly protein PilF